MEQKIFSFQTRREEQGRLCADSSPPREPDFAPNLILCLLLVEYGLC